jgi:hypothetical protein
MILPNVITSSPTWSVHVAVMVVEGTLLGETTSDQYAPSNK